MIRQTKTETWKGSFLKTAVLLLMFGAAGAGQAQLAPQNFFVWDKIFGIGANQNAELILASEGCTKPFTVDVETTDQNGVIVHEVLHLGMQQFSSAVYQLPVSHNLAERSLFRVKLGTELGPCANALQAALTIINVDGTTATVSQIPTHTPEWSDLNTSDPGMLTYEGRPNTYFNILPTRIGPSQAAEFAFWNNCQEEISVTLQLKTIGAEEKFTLLDVVIPPLQFGTASVEVSSDEKNVALVGFGNFVVKERAERKENDNPCPLNQWALTGTQTLVDSDGNTKQVSPHSGLPTGKRQHRSMVFQPESVSIKP